MMWFDLVVAADPRLRGRGRAMPRGVAAKRAAAAGYRTGLVALRGPPVVADSRGWRRPCARCSPTGSVTWLDPDTARRGGAGPVPTMSARCCKGRPRRLPRACRADACCASTSPPGPRPARRCSTSRILPRQVEAMLRAAPRHRRGRSADRRSPAGRARRPRAGPGASGRRSRCCEAARRRGRRATAASAATVWAAGRGAGARGDLLGAYPGGRALRGRAGRGRAGPGRGLDAPAGGLAPARGRARRCGRRSCMACDAYVFATDAGLAAVRPGRAWSRPWRRRLCWCCRRACSPSSRRRPIYLRAPATAWPIVWRR